MTTIFVEVGVLCISLIWAIYFQMGSEKNISRDGMLFRRLLLATISILFVDTLGWILDGHPIAGQTWIITMVDGLDLINTTVVCWCWVQYALYIAKEEKQKEKKWFQDGTNWLLILQIILVCSSQIFHFYYSVDAMGVYHRERGYFVHFLIATAMLVYSSVSCLLAYAGETEEERKRELRFVAFIILIPILGNVFQLYVYGYPTVWLCMTFMIFTVYVHIQNKRIGDERDRQNKILEDALKEAQTANRAKTDFLARMSHDMRTPMNGILGLTTLLRDRTDPQEIQRDVDQIEKSGKFLLNLINDTLDMNKIESGKMELHPVPINSEDLFGNVIVTAQILAGQKGVKLHMELPSIPHGQWIPVIADPSRVEQVFMNLITNAVKFTPQGGSVTIHMDTISVTSQQVTDRYVVADTGIGMSEEFQKHLFEPFSQEGRANTDYESGTGLGLAIVKQIIDLMGGSIKIESKLNEGTQITLILTYPRYPGVLEVSHQQSIDLNNLKGKRILLCEDHPINAQIAIRLLEKQGMETLLAENGKEGLDQIQSSEPGYFDAILMDIRMPVMNGIEAAKAIRSLPDRPDAQSIPIIAMTANAFEEDIHQCAEAGMDAHLSKPVDAKLLYEKISEVCQLHKT